MSSENRNGQSCAWGCWHCTWPFGNNQSDHRGQDEPTNCSCDIHIVDVAATKHVALKLTDWVRFRTTPEGSTNDYFSTYILAMGSDVWYKTWALDTASPSVTGHRFIILDTCNSVARGAETAKMALHTKFGLLCNYIFGPRSNIKCSLKLTR